MQREAKVKNERALIIVFYTNNPALPTTEVNKWPYLFRLIQVWFLSLATKECLE